MRPEDISNYFDTKWFSTLAGLGNYITIILAAILILTIFYFLLIKLEHKIKITIFPIYGADIDKVNDVKDIKELNGYNIGIGHPKLRNGKDTKHHGIRKFSILMNKLLPIPMVVKEVPMQYRYPDGIWFIQPSKDTLIPIFRPDICGAMNIKVTETDMDLWQQASEADIRRRTQDDDIMKKQMLFTIFIIIGAFALAGLIIWLSMAFAGKSIDNVLVQIKPMTQALEKIAGETPPG